MKNGMDNITDSFTSETWQENGKGHYTNRNDLYMDFFKRYLRKSIKNCPIILEIGPGDGSFGEMLIDELEGVNEYVILDLKTNIQNPLYTLARTGQSIYPIYAHEYIHLQELNSFNFDLVVSNVCIPETPKKYYTDLLELVVPKTKNIMLINQIEGKWDDGSYKEWITNLFFDYFETVILEKTNYANCYCMIGKEYDTD